MTPRSAHQNSGERIQARALVPREIATDMATSAAKPVANQGSKELEMMVAK